MRALSFALIFGCLSVSGAALQQLPAASIASASIEGAALRWRTSEPVAGVSVELRESGGKRVSIPAALTRQDGSFVFPSVPPGKYHLIGMRPGYLRSEFGQSSYIGSAQELNVSAGQKMSGVQLIMTPGAVISGKVTDRGQPVALADVIAMKASSYEGKIQLTAVLSAKTNDLGEYSIFWLPPGSYYVVALNEGTGSRRPILINTDGSDDPVPMPAELGRVRKNTNGNLSRTDIRRQRAIFSGTASAPAAADGYVPMFYPGTADILAAQPVHISPGAEFPRIDIDSPPMPRYRVRGRISDMPPGPDGQRLSVTVRLDPVRSNSLALASTSASTGPDGYFNLAAPAGSYQLVLSLGSRRAYSWPVEVRSDITGLVLTPPPAIRPWIKVTIEDGNQNTAGLTLGLRQLRETEVYPLLPEGNGVYKLPAADPGIPAGTYVVTVAPVLTLVPPRVSAPERPAAFRNMYVKSVRFGDVDGLREGVRLESEPQVPIEVVLGTNPGGVKGRVLNEQKEPAAAAFVALVPEGGRRYRSKYEFTSSDASGNFDLSNVPPGDYKLFAWEVAERMDLDDPLFMRRYESLGTPVHIEEGGKVVLDATVIPL